MRSLSPETWDRLEALWMRIWRPVRSFLDGFGGFLSKLMSWDGLVIWGFILLGMGAFPFLPGWIPGWIRTPFSGGLSAWDLSVVPGQIDLGRPGRRLLSFGGLILALLLWALLTRLLRSRLRGRFQVLDRPRGFHATLGLLAFGLVSWFFLVSAFIRPDILQDLIEQVSEMDRMKQFDNAYVKGNIGVVRLAKLSDDTLWEQMTALVGHLGMGYWYATLGALCLIAGGLRIMHRERTSGAPRSPPEEVHGKALPLAARLPVPLVSAVAFLLVLAFFGGVLGVQSLVADALVTRADTWSGRGDYQRAHRLYRRARNLDHRLAINDTFLEKMGRAAWRMGDRDSPEARYFLAHQYRWEYDYRNAAWHLRQAMQELRRTGRTRALPAFRRYLETVLTRWGRALYDEGKFQGALDRWHEAYLLDPNSYELPYYLSHAYYRTDGVDQERTIALNRKLLSRVRDRIMLSDLYCNLGEAYYRQKDYAKARVNYERSLDMYNFVKDINYRAQKGMLGLGVSPGVAESW